MHLRKSHMKWICSLLLMHKSKRVKIKDKYEKIIMNPKLQCGQIQIIEIAYNNKLVNEIQGHVVREYLVGRVYVF